MDTIFNIEKKENTLEMLEYTFGKPSKNFQFADEFNEIVKKAIEANLNNTEINFTWSNLPAEYTYPIEEVKIQNLYLHLENLLFLENATELKLIIERYKHKRNLRTKIRQQPVDGQVYDYEFARSGFKKPRSPYPDRPSEIVLLNREEIDVLNKYFPYKTELKIKQLNYFFINLISKNVSARGMNSQDKNKNLAYCFLRFRFEIKRKDNSIITTQPLIVVKMICKKELSGQFVVSYKLT